MEVKDFIEGLEKGWPGWLALGFVLLKESNIGEKFWGLFVKQHERKQAKDDTYEEIAIATVKRTLEASADLPVKLKNIEYLIANQGDIVEELLHAVRSLGMESSIKEKKLNQILLCLDQAMVLIKEIKESIGIHEKQEDS